MEEFSCNLKKEKKCKAETFNSFNIAITSKKCKAETFNSSNILNPHWAPVKEHSRFDAFLNTIQ